MATGVATPSIGRTRLCFGASGRSGAGMAAPGHRPFGRALAGPAAAWTGIGKNTRVISQKAFAQSENVLYMVLEILVAADYL